MPGSPLAILIPLATTVAFLLVAVSGCAPAPAPGGAAPTSMDASVAVADGGVYVSGWTGRIDPQEAAAGLALEDARIEERDGALHVTTGPAVTYWNPDQRASGDYTVRATFTEPRFMSLMDHPHPYGIVIAGDEMGSDRQRYLYCSAYGNGTFIVRGFGPEPFRVNDARPEAHPAVSQAAEPGQPVTQEIALSVRGDRVECAINGTVVGSYERAQVVDDGRLSSTDGIYGLRFGHNTEVTVRDLRLERP